MGKKSVKRPKNDALRYDVNRLASDPSTLEAFLDEAAKDFIQEDCGGNQLPPIGKKIQNASTYGTFGPTKRERPKSALLEAASQALGYSEPETSAEGDYADSTVAAIMQAAADVSGALDEAESETAIMDVPEPVRQGLTSDRVGAPKPTERPFRHRRSVSFGGNPRKLRIKDELGNCIVIPSLVSGTDALKVDNAKDAIMQWLRHFAVITMAPHAIFETEDFIKAMAKAGIKEAPGFTFLISQELAPEYVLCYNMNDKENIADWNVIADQLCEDYDDSAIAGIMISAMIHLYKNRWAANLSSDAIESWLDDDNDRAQEHFMFDLTHDEATMMRSRNATTSNFGILDYDQAIDCMVNGLSDYVDLRDYELPEGMDDGSEEEGAEEEYEESSAPTPIDPGYYSEETRGASNDEEPFPNFDATETRRVFEGAKRSTDVRSNQPGTGADTDRSVPTGTPSDKEVQKAEEAKPECPVPADNGSGNDQQSEATPEEKEEKKTEVGNQRPELPEQRNTPEEKDEEESMVVGLICN